ncbi:MAG: class I SAM-dependent methyltransferase [Lachnospiraceae bacterium]|nr:class I SAM-dependent methyltransferase [Lachnospiraceae bacterium]
MFWDKVSSVYDLFENIYNKRVYQSTGETVAKYIKSTDRVLECACGTGAISIYIAPRCSRLYATDYSVGMLKQARKKLKKFDNVSFKRVDITGIKARDDSFDVVVAGNVIHLLSDPQSAMKELTRVCRNGGRLIIPTYINGDRGTNKLAVRFLEKLGANFKCQFDAESYAEFFARMGYEDVTYEVVRGKMSCDIAIIEVRKNLNQCLRRHTCKRYSTSREWMN